MSGNVSGVRGERTVDVIVVLLGIIVLVAAIFGKATTEHHMRRHGADSGCGSLAGVILAGVVLALFAVMAGMGG